jgi:hypothetical protein
MKLVNVQVMNDKLIRNTNQEQLLNIIGDVKCSEGIITESNTLKLNTNYYNNSMKSNSFLESFMANNKLP